MFFNKLLENEREAVRQALSDECVVKHSYVASENAVVHSCLQDVEDCDLYVLILGLRYGYIPQRELDNPNNLSITELEYQRASKKPRLVFLKEMETIPFALTDAATKDNPLERIEAFRERAAKPEDQRPAFFKTADDLKLAVVKAFNRFKEERTPKGRKPGLQIELTTEGATSLRDYPEMPDDLVLAICSREAAENRLPPIEWCRRSLAALPANQEVREAYAYRVHEWYKRVEVMVKQRYERERWCYRTFHLTFKVSNAGHSPAERVKITCIFPNDVILDETEPSVYSFSTPAAQNSEDRVPVAATPNRAFPEWSRDLIGRTRSPYLPYEHGAINYLIHRDTNSLAATSSSLEHGDEKLLRPVRLSFRSNAPIRTFDVIYKLHATNQPDDVEGHLTVVIHCDRADVFGNLKQIRA